MRVGPATGSYFIFDEAMEDEEARFNCVVHPGKHLAIEQIGALTWNDQCHRCEDWLRIVKQEYEAPDLWAAIAEPVGVVVRASDVENKPFNQDERAQIYERLQEIRKYLIEVIEIQAENREFFDRKFQYLEESLSRLDRKDFLHVFISVILSIIFCDPQVQARASDFFQFAARQIGAATDFVVNVQQNLPQ